MNNFLKMPTHYCNQCNQQKIEHTDRQKIFPFKIQQLIDAQPWKRPPEPHNYEYQEKGFTQEPNA